MKRFFASLLLLFFAVAGFAQQEVDNGYVIKNWVYNAVVHPDNSWTVSERLDVEFLEYRHGIYRNIPTVFVKKRVVDGDTLQYTYVSQIRGISVLDEHCELLDAEDEQNSIVMRIGDEYTTLIGPHTYTINYTLRYPDDRWKGCDDIVHTVLGATCNTVVENFDFVITFDKGLPASVAKDMKVYSGPWGGQDNSLGVLCSVQGDSIVGHASDVKPFQAISIAAPLPEGFWRGAPAVDSTPAYGFLGAAGVLLLLLLVYFLTHKRYPPTVVYEYAAPDGVSSAEVGTIIDDSADLSDLTSLIVWWGSKGYLKIVEQQVGRKKVEIELIKLRDLPETAPSYQQYFWDVFFEDKDRVTLSALGDKHVEIQSAQKALTAHFTGERKLVKTDLKALLLMVAYFVTGGLAIGHSSTIEADHEYTIFAGLLAWGLVVFLAALSRLKNSDKDLLQTEKQKMWRYIRYAVGAAINIWVFKTAIFNAPDMLWPFEAYAAIIASGWVVALFAGRMKADTAYRKEMMSRLIGFRDFIEKSELPMLKAQVDENPNLFFDVLPFALVFGLSDKWCKQFEPLGIMPPDWYESDSLNSNMAPYMMGHALANNLSRDFNREICAAVRSSSIDPSAHSSSGGGGGYSGGFSGGGGGGGGVGSW